MDKKERSRYVRLIYRHTFKHLGAALVLSLIAGTLLGGGFYTVSAVCAAGFVLICWGWFGYLKATGMHPFGRAKAQKKVKIPYIHRRFKDKRLHRPSFQMDSADFDDDLTAETLVSEEIFTERQAAIARMTARLVCGAVLVLFSFFIPF